MQDFLDGLDQRLMSLAEAQDQEAAAATHARPRRRRRPAVLGGLTAGLAAVVAAFTMVGTSAADLPILSTATTDASRLKDVLPSLASRGVDFSQAHVFGTPGGPGYVFQAREGGPVCMAIPDAGTPGEYGSSCSGSLAQVERDGLGAELAGDRGSDRDAQSTFAFVLPDHAKDVRVTLDGRRVRPQIDSGVVTATSQGPARISWTVRGVPADTSFQGPFETTSFAYDCGDGRMATGPPLDTDGKSLAESNAALKKARRAACG